MSVEKEQRNGRAIPDEALLAESDLFRSLDEADRQWLIDKMAFSRFARGEVLVTQGVAKGELFLIASGLVSVIVEDEQGTPTEVAQLGRGGIIGELSLLTGNLPNATVVAALDTETWALRHDDFDTLLSQSIPLALSVNRVLGSKLAATNRRLGPQRTAELTALVGDRSTPATRRIAMELGASLARYTRERVLVIDCFPSGTSPTADQTPWGAPVENVLADSALLAAHHTPPRLDDPFSGARLIRFSDDGRRATPGALLSLATHLRNLYSHIIFDLPIEYDLLLADTLPMVNNVVAVTSRERLHSVGNLLRRTDVRNARRNGILAVTGWEERFKMRDVWAIEERHRWPVASLIEDQYLEEGVDRLARWVARLRVGIAWGGGTARGWALAGIASALEQLKVPMDAFAGTSAGALGAAVYGLSLDYKQADERMRSVLPFLKRTTRPMLPLTISRHSLLSERWWDNLIRTFVADESFGEMLVPFAAVALDLTEGRQHVFDRGPLWKAIRASSSVPALAPPMMIDGRPYADGGVVNAVPIDVVSDMGADILIGIDLTGAESEGGAVAMGKPNMLGTVMRTINVAYNTAASRTIPLADVLIRPTLRSAAVYDITVMDEFMAEGKRATLAALPALQEAMPWIEG